MRHRRPRERGRARRSRSTAGRSVSRAAQGPDSGRKTRRREPAVSRVLSGTIIHLGQSSPTASSNLPGSPLGTGGADCSAYSPIWSCSRRGLPCRGVLPPARCALTAPFHPCRRATHAWAVCFLWHFPWTHVLQALPGALSDGARTFLRRQKPNDTGDCLADSHLLEPRMIPHFFAVISSPRTGPASCDTGSFCSGR